MRSVSTTDNVVPFRRPAGLPRAGQGGFAGAVARSGRADQRSLMDLVYATGAFILGADDRETKLIASRLQVYGFLLIEEIAADGTLRRLRPSEAIRAREDRPWRLTKSSYGSSLAVTMPGVGAELFRPDALDA